jgi:superfamily II DNA/RNA helicase
MALDENNYRFTTPIQQRVIEEGILNGQNMIITAESGSGKTLSYLLPLINELNFYKDNNDTNASYFKFNKDTEELMFQNANELQYQEKKNTKKNTSGKHDDPKGAIILSYSKEMANQIYVLLRKMDTKKRFSLNRATSSLQMKSPIVEFITPDTKKGEKEYNEDELFSISLANVINNASWNISDVILCTPVVISHILETKSQFNPLDINPKTIIIDEFDELF